MKIAVLHRYPPDQVIGTNASFVEFLLELNRQHNEVYYVTYKSGGNGTKIPGINFVELPFTFKRGNHFDKILKTYIWILLVPFVVAYLQRKYKLDLVYCDDSIPYYGFICKVISPWSKVVIRLGDLQSAYALADDHKSLFNLALSFETFMWSKLDGVVAISDAFKTFIKEKLPKENVAVVEESVNLSENIKPSVGISKTILFHGALVKCKGLIVLLKAFKLFNEANNISYQLVIAGGGEEEKTLKDYVLKNKIQNVKFTGWYDHKTLGEIMKSVDISVVMRSTNLGNNFVVTTCLLENWKFMKPVIVPDLQSFRDAVSDNDNGIFFKPGSETDLSQKIDYLYKHEDIWPRLVESGLNTAKLKFDHKLIARKMCETLKSFI